MAYSAVIQPSPRPRRQAGTPSSTEAVHSTRVAPNATTHEPSAYGATPRSRVIGRSSLSPRPTRAGGCSNATESLNCGSGGVTRCERHDDDATTPGANLARSNDRILAVVAAFHKHVRTKLK